MMTGNEIRESFLRHFERHGHVRVASSPLLPANDPTLLFANAGMNQFKDVFTGAETRNYTRAVSVQKCLRAGGKHNDLDDVGDKTHQTFFEMLGNFSFGDYFKREAIGFAWELLVDVYKLPVERLWFTVYCDDDEAEKLWIETGATPSRVLRFDAKDNFWQMGDTGPCGPCSEIHYYKGDAPQDPAKNHAGLVNLDGSPTVEIWNLVFMQFERAADGTLTPLPKPSVDTGAGFERVAAVLQGVESNYDTDIMRPIIDFVAQLANKPYDAETAEGFAMRVITDHARATVFSIADGILPGNEGRNYVLRKIMRRAIYHGRHALGFNDLFFYKVTDHVIELMREAYPELDAARSFVERMVKLEESRFASTLTVGLQKLHALLMETAGGFAPEYRELARLYDTFGTPRDLIRVRLEELGHLIDEEEFNKRFDAALHALQQTSTNETIAHKTSKSNPVYAQILERVGETEFVGYTNTQLGQSEVTAIIKDGTEVNSLDTGESGEIALSRTPFYAEAGGQVGDAGKLITSGATISNDAAHAALTFEDAWYDIGSGGAYIVVNDTTSPVRGLTVHKVFVERGKVQIGSKASAIVDSEKRDATRRNHTATHLMHAALREVLGAHVKQAGSLVAPNRLRFDFSHYQPLTPDERAEIERLVNYHILRNEPVQTEILPLEEAMRSGAMALFGEKYTERVRVLTVPGFSKELCGGTHVRATGDIGLFKIVRDEAIASGTRRIEAVTGADAFTRFQETEALIERTATELRTTRADVPAMVERLQEELKRARREAEELRLRLAAGASDADSSNGAETRTVRGVSVLAREASGLDAAGLRQLSDALMAKTKSGVVVLGRRDDGKASLIVRTSPDLRARVPAGSVIRELAPVIGGRGGGRPDMAEGGGNEPQKLAEALQASFEIIERLLAQNETTAAQ